MWSQKRSLLCVLIQLNKTSGIVKPKLRIVCGSVWKWKYSPSFVGPDFRAEVQAADSVHAKTQQTWPVKKAPESMFKFNVVCFRLQRKSVVMALRHPKQMSLATEARKGPWRTLVGIFPCLTWISVSDSNRFNASLDSWCLPVCVSRY